LKVITTENEKISHSFLEYFKLKSNKMGEEGQKINIKCGTVL